MSISMRAITRIYLSAVIALGLILIGGITASATGLLSPQSRITRNQRVVIEIDPNDSGTALFHCHSHAITGANHNTYVFTHCKHGS